MRADHSTAVGVFLASGDNVKLLTWIASMARAAMPNNMNKPTQISRLRFCITITNLQT